MTAPSNQQNRSSSNAAGTLTLVTHAQALQAALNDLSTLTVQQLVALFRELGTRKDFPILLKTAFPEIITPHTQAAAEITAQWYDELTVTKTPSTAVVDIPADRMAKTVDWALYAPSGNHTESHQHVHPDENIRAEAVESEPHASILTDEQRPSQDMTLSRLSGSAKRMVFDASRTTVITNSTGQTRYARYASANACAFCRLLATRSDEYLYRTQNSAVRVVGVGRGDRIRGTRAVGEKFHDHCRCIVVPIPAGQTWEAPGYVGDWQQQYQAAREAAGKNPTTKDILAHMRSMETPTRGGSAKAGSRTAARVEPRPAETKKDIAARHLPGLEKNLQALRKQGLPEDSTQIQYHLKTIARLKADIEKAK